MRRLSGRLARGLSIAAVVALVCVAFGGPLFRALIAGTIDVATGYRVAFDDIGLRSGRAIVRNLYVSRAGEPVFAAGTVDVQYRLRDLFPGSSHRYGLVSFVLVRPRLTLMRRSDGSFTLFTPGAGGGAQAPLPQQAEPLTFKATISGGSLELLDASRVFPQARRLALEALGGSVVFNSAGHSAYALHGRVAGAPAQTFTLGGRSEAGGYALYRLRGPALVLLPGLEYLINSSAARPLAGRLRELDVKAYTFGPAADGTTPYHIVGSGQIEAGAMRVPGVLPPATRMRGRIDVFDGGLAAPRLAATLGPLNVALAGGMYGWRAPSFRLAVTAPDAPLRDVRTLFGFSRRLPLRGRVRLASLLEGPVGDPLVATRLAAPALAYGAFPIVGTTARAIYSHGAVDIVGAHGRYGGLDVRVNGAVDLGPTAKTQLVVELDGAAARVPYLAQAAPGTDVEAEALLAGRGTRLAALGTVSAGGGGTRAAGVFHLNELGDGMFGPLGVLKPDGSSLVGTFYSNRTASESGFWLDARRFAFVRPAVPPLLPGIALRPPQFSGTLDGALAGEGPPTAFRVAGRIRARDVHAGRLVVDAAAGAVAGAFSNLTLGGVGARGAWGAFRGRGAYAGGRLALAGDYHGSFAQLASLTGNLGASGPINGPVSMLLGPGQTIVQARGDSTLGSHLRGVSLDSLAGTLGVGARGVRVFAGTAALGGGTLAAAGTLGGAAGLGLSLGDVAGHRLRDLVPLGDGRLSAVGTLQSAHDTTRFSGGVAVAGASLDRLPFAANGEVTASATRIELRSVDASVGPALGRLAGSIAGLGTSALRYDIGLHLAAARLGPFARAVAPERTDVAGTLSGDFRLAGTRAAPTLSGAVRAPEGTLHGLAFQAASARVRLDPAGFSAEQGTIALGSTRAAFEAAFRGNDAALRVDLPHADLSDFNGYFDAGDVLGGRGRIVARFVKHGTAASTTGDTAITALHYRRFDLGDASAHWSSRGPNVRGAAAFGGASGRLQAAGTLVLAHGVPLSELLARSRFAGNAQLRGLDLGVWLPALGYQLPLGGRVDANATIRGALRRPEVDTQAALAHGSYGRFPIDRLALAATSTLARTTVTHAELALPGLAATLSGSFGLRPRDPLALALHASSPNIGALAARAFGTTAFTGAAELDAKVAGTRAVPRLAGGFDFENGTVRGVTIPRALGEFGVRGRDVVLSDVEVAFATGTAYFAGSVPLQIAPLTLGPRAAPITLELTAKAVDLADFAPLLPSGSTLRGRVDGQVQVSGTAGSPRLGGALALSDGAFRSPLETEPLSRLRAALTFSGQAARLDALHAEAGGGTLDAAGSASFPSLVHPGIDAAYRFQARANRLRLSVPAYGNGQLDGTLDLTHAAGRAPLLAGNVALSEATIPFSALLLSGGGSSGAFDTPAGAAPAPPAAGDVALDVTLGAARNVRVRSANVDIGARGNVHVGGSRSAPELTGAFTSTGGTLAYFNTVFRLTEATVAFAPARGLIPTLDAQATTHVIDPDPNGVRNLSGTADITLDLSGPVNGLTIGLSSYPAYDREQILGLLLNAPALGATNLFGDARGTPTLYGSNSPNALGPGVVGNRGTNGQLSVAQEAFGIANAQFTRTLLAPIESGFASVVGLSSFNVNVDYTGSVGVTARKVLGKKLNALYGTSFGYPYRQTFGFEFKPSDVTAAQVTVFQTLGAAGLSSLAPATLGAPNQRLQAAQPATGTVGFSLSLQRLYP